MHETTPAGAIVGRDLAAPFEEPAVGEEAVDPDRAARVKLLRADPDLGAEAEAEAVREARARVVKDARGVDLGHEALRRGIVVGDDRVRMTRAVALDVRERVVETGDVLDR